MFPRSPCRRRPGRSYGDDKSRPGRCRGADSEDVGASASSTGSVVLITSMPAGVVRRLISVIIPTPLWKQRDLYPKSRVIRTTFPSRSGLEIPDFAPLQYVSRSTLVRTADRHPHGGGGGHRRPWATSHPFPDPHPDVAETDLADRNRSTPPARPPSRPPPTPLRHAHSVFRARRQRLLVEVRPDSCRKSLDREGTPRWFDASSECARSLGGVAPGGSMNADDQSISHICRLSGHTAECPAARARSVLSVDVREGSSPAPSKQKFTCSLAPSSARPTGVT